MKRAPSRTAIGYIRVSTDQNRQALGAEAQRQAIQAWADRQGLEVLAWHLEEVSGGASLDKRPVLLAALAEVEARGAAFLAVSKLDRFSRDPLTAALAEATLRRSGASLAVADGNGAGADPTSELVRGILLNVAKFEKAMIGARIRAALAVKAGRGERISQQLPYGSELAQGGRLLAPCASELETLARARELRAAGRKLREVSAILAAEGRLNRMGKPFALPAVHKMTQDPSRA